MYVKIKNDQGETNTTLFIKYDGTGDKLEEFNLEWNPDFKMD
jgi:hypothetical protein